MDHVGSKAPPGQDQVGQGSRTCSASLRHRTFSNPHIVQEPLATNGKLASMASIVLGALLIVGSVGAWVMASSTLADQRITTPDDACLPGRDVTGPFTASCQARIVDQRALESTNGLIYAELDREDPLRNVAMNSSFLHASLFTSVLAFGVAAMAAGMGVIFILIGVGMRDVSTNLARDPSASGR